jgi:chitinase
MQDLGTLGGQNSSAEAINLAGQIGGQADVSAGITHAALWTASNQIQDLGTLGGTYAYARGINDKGAVVGASYLP